MKDETIQEVIEAMDDRHQLVLTPEYVAHIASLDPELGVALDDEVETTGREWFLQVLAKDCGLEEWPTGETPDAEADLFFAKLRHKLTTRGQRMRSPEERDVEDVFETYWDDDDEEADEEDAN